MKKVLMSSIFIISFVFIACILLLNQSIQPYRDIRKQTVQHVESYLAGEPSDPFYLYQGQETSYASVMVLGQDQNYKLAMVEESTGNIDLYDADEILSEYEVSQLFYQDEDQDIVDLRIGREEEQAFWEVLSKNQDGSLFYHYYDLQNGKALDSIRL